MMRTLPILVTLALLPLASAGLPGAGVLVADDAGSGRDAPLDHARAIPAEPGNLYAGAFQHIWLTPDTLFWDLHDSYVFHANADDAITARVKGAITGTSLYAPDGTELAFDASTASVEYTGLEARAPATGDYILDIAGLSVPQFYCFIIGIGEPATMQSLVDPLCGA